MKLGQFLTDKQATNKVTVIAVDWLEGRYGADANRLERIIRREIPPSAFVLQGTDATSKLFGTIDSVPAYFLFDRTGKVVWAVGGGSDEQNRFGLDTDALERVIAGR